MTVSSLFQLKRSSVGKLMLFRCHRQIDNRQNHKYEGLQRENQNVENGPSHIQDPLSPPRQQTSNQKENQLTGIHVAEQSQTKRDWFGQQAYPFKD